MKLAKYRVQLSTEKKYSSKYEYKYKYEYSIPDAKVTHSRIGRRMSHGYDPASSEAIRISP